MSDLFSATNAGHAPLAARLRPEAWPEFAGQQELAARLRGRPLHSMILYGPPGCGKTTLARILAAESGRAFRHLSAVSSGVKEVREAIDEGKRSFQSGGGGLALFLDEIHRFSKSQQDAMLEAVENGWIILIGATTENPSFEVIGPLLSRAQAYRLLPLGEQELLSILQRAMSADLAMQSFRLAEDAAGLLVESAGGDARRMLSALEQAAEAARQRAPAGATGIPIEAQQVRAAAAGRLRRYDRAGENHYDFVSALIKSLRGSDPDAALLYLACMLEGGEDPLFIARRLIIFSSEDIGNAYPQALSTAVAAFAALERIGLPEGRIVLAQAVTLLASAPKSNASYLAIDAALQAVRGRTVTIPDHLRNAPTELHRREGASSGYRYPHDFPGAFVEENYLPPAFTQAQFYRPVNRGQEARLGERLRALWPLRDYHQETE
ncbi:MAG: replication-associated recombination protein A [Leptospirales bacterium]|nr:replication-associated recombination protein A [Leptospirales bacterium]